MNLSIAPIRTVKSFRFSAKLAVHTSQSSFVYELLLSRGNPNAFMRAM